jgi:predicted transposase/invertase (TIGR01784 family)
VKTRGLDYVIITEHSYFSCADPGLLEQLEASTKYLLSYELERKLHEELQAAREEIEQESKIKIKASLKQGEEKGLKKRELEIAKQMLAKGLDIELICEMTGLSKQRICSL